MAKKILFLLVLACSVLPPASRLALADHPVYGEDPRMPDQIYLVGRGGALVSLDDPADGTYDGLPPYDPEATCRGCHGSIFNNEVANFHACLGCNDLVLPRGTLDPARPWIFGPRKFGGWCPTGFRQWGDITKTFASEAEFLAQVDMGFYDFILQCGTCHVGGGPGVRHPLTLAEHDDVNRDLFSLTVQNYYVKDGNVTLANWVQLGGGGAGTLKLDCLVCHLEGYDILARNEQIVRYEKFKNAPTLGAGLAAMDPAAPDGASMAYDAFYVARNGSNHLYLGRNFLQRIKRTPPSANCLNCHMPSVVEGEDAAVSGDAWKREFFNTGTVPSDDPENPDPLAAANRRPAGFRNDFLKRGATWRTDEVHKFMECSGCHLQTAKFQTDNATAPGYLHSPGKGYDPLKDPIGGEGTVKFCTDCHVLFGDLDGDGVKDIEIFAPPDPRPRHAAAGLSAAIIGTARRIGANGQEETFRGSHIDVIACTVCHVWKQYTAARAYDFSTGGRFYTFDGNPPDVAGGPETVTIAYTWRENTPVRVLPDGSPNPMWRRQVHPFNYVTSIYWNNTGTKDANGDGFRSGDSNGGTTVLLDPFFGRVARSHFRYDFVNTANDRVPSGLAGVPAYDERSEWAMANAAGGVMFTRPGEIDAYQALLSGEDPGYAPQLRLEAKPYLLVHNVMPIKGPNGHVLGKPVRDDAGNIVAYGCGDCHGPSGVVYNGEVNLLGKGIDIATGAEAPLALSWSDPGDVSAEAEYWDAFGNRHVLDCTSGSTLRNPRRYELLGLSATEAAGLDLVTAADNGIGVDPVAVIASINGTVPDGSGTPITVRVGEPVTLAADTSVNTAGYIDYGWISSDAAGEVLPGATVSKTFSTVGTWLVTLKVTDEEGKLAQVSQEVNAVNLPAADISYVGTVSGVQTIRFANLPAHTMLYIFWGDGLKSRVYDTVSPKDVDHDFRLYAKYDKGDHYEFKVTAYVYDGSTRVDVKQAVVSIPKADNP
ncbi:PKD domain-containing protein [Dissulfurirhabdus thermomarina]|uniref:PKD domain-containing protein n=1 Tax=Dissulfurirhabdus thermomarina TaxID=1765737 RepID=A0A6N9TS78_DISTH|nr:PKD domain-containing protein [Dissulfurirhabdus thermomarina]NDY41426.1 PKD domain-containing protein [Dissulfurirhabdus thermomarina]NMX24414.1 PKD domain-containing protein [Dissulfurirhabdus thermomarina]